MAAVSYWADMIFRIPVGGAAALALMLLVASCDGGGSSMLRVHFSITSNHGGCDGADVRLYLDSSDAVLGRNADGTLSCQIAPVLASRGCSLAVDESDDGTWVEFRVDCPIGTVSDFFYCDFLEANVSSPHLGLVTNCGCDPTSCHLLGRCVVCASVDEDGSTCEHCDNNVDDDGDGDVDCEDSDCDFTEECGYGVSTLQCGSMTTTTTSTSLTTSTTMISALGTEIEEMCFE
jgi:hypothetical protein